MSEHRQFPRIHHSFEIDVSPSATSAGAGKNVSQGGLRFLHNDPLQVGTILDLTMKAPNNAEKIQLKAKVIRCWPAGSGSAHNVSANFVDLDPEREKEITAFLHSFDQSE